jgi:hypothetical protein
MNSASGWYASSNTRKSAWKSNYDHLHCKKGYQFSIPQPKPPWPGIIKFFPARESLVSDIPAGEGKTVNIFYSVDGLCFNVAGCIAPGKTFTLVNYLLFTGLSPLVRRCNGTTAGPGYLEVE